MKLALLAAAPLLLMASCSSPRSPERETFLATERVVVSGELARSETTWTLRNLVAEEPTGGPSRLRELGVTAFADLDEDGEIDDSERRGSWHVSSSTKASRLSANGMFGAEELPLADLSALKLEVRVTFVGTELPSEEVVTIVPLGF